MMLTDNVFYPHACRETREGDVRFKVLYCGICHSDLHLIKNDFDGAELFASMYPMVPGCVPNYLYSIPISKIYTLIAQLCTRTRADTHARVM